MFGSNFFAVLGIEHLIFVAEGAAAFFENKVFYSVIGTFGKFPFPSEIKLREFLLSDDVAGFAAGFELQFAVLNGPAFFGEGLLLETAPAVCGLAVEQ